MNKRNITLVLAVAVMVVVAALGIMVGVNIGKGDKTPEPGITDAADPTTGGDTHHSGPQHDMKSFCGLKAVKMDDSNPTGPMGFKPSEWTYVYRLGVPTVKGIGPGYIDPDTNIASCFARTPEGALFAAVWGNAQQLSPELDWVTVQKQRLSKGENREDILSIADEIDRDLANQMEFNLRGYRILDYDGFHARVDVAAEASAQGGSIYFADEYIMIWEDGDWKLDTNVSLEEIYETRQITSLSGYYYLGLDGD
ncbi:MAG: hypothetical protein FWG08_01810 [Propionibacteriaceae bacterium]|nr:hypothetical protein [Propionibacteriaceae bacterium]